MNHDQNPRQPTDGHEGCSAFTGPVRKPISRREFLKFGALMAAPLLAPRASALAAGLYTPSLPSEPSPPPAPLGRIATWYRQAVRETPSPTGTVVAWRTRDEVLPLFAALDGEAPWPTNPVWYQTEGGYIHSGYVQPVRDEPQPVVRVVGEPGFWAQVAQPWAEARWSPTSPYLAFKLYYGTVYRVVAAEIDAEDSVWYQLKEGLSTWRPGPYVRGTSLRPVSPNELAPISPGHPDKWLRIDRQSQTLDCIEGETTVFSTRVATGHAGTPTPRGEFRVLYKRHTRRMNVQNISDPYDLPGVPFCTYFTWSGVAIHGTYWHNDYGRVHSHGCVNVTSEAAQWIFRWVEPIAPYEVYTQAADPADTGTRVVVV